MALLSRRRRAALPTAEPISLLAAAAPVDGGAKSSGSGGRDSAWKTDAWDYYDRVGELRFVCAWLEHSLSRCALIASTVDPATGQPTGECDDPVAVDTVADIAGGPAGQAAMLGRLATFLTVPGEGYIAIIHRDIDGRTVEEWHVLSESEIKKKGGSTVELELPDGHKHVMDPDVDTLERIWRPHPRRALDSDSPVRACLPILREIVRMGQNIEAAGKSRNAGNGLLLLPKEMSMPTGTAPRAEAPPASDPDAPGLPVPPPPAVKPVTANDVMIALKTAMETAISDPSSAAALVPIILSSPGEHLDKVKHITFASTLTEVSLKTREAAIRRLALSLDVPAEVLLGLSQGNHWSSWMVDESAIKTHIVPLMVLICDALTVAVLRPMLKLQGHPDPDSITLWFDPSGLTLRPNRSEDAKEAHARGAISTEALRRELGFSDSDAPPALDDTEKQRALAIELVKAAPTLLPMLADTIGLPITTTAAAPAEAGPTPDATGGNPPIPDTAAVRVAAAMAARRLMEVTGKRRRTRGNLPNLAEVEACDTHQALGGTDNPVRYMRPDDRREVVAAADTCRADRNRLAALVVGRVSQAIHDGLPATAITFTDAELRAVLP